MFDINDHKAKTKKEKKRERKVFGSDIMHE